MTCLESGEGRGTYAKKKRGTCAAHITKTARTPLVMWVALAGVQEQTSYIYLTQPTISTNPSPTNSSSTTVHVPLVVY